MTEYQQTHWDISEAGRVCHDECAVAQIKLAAERMRARCAALVKAEALVAGTTDGTAWLMRIAREMGELKP